MSTSLTIVVTGSNRGIGQGIIHLLSKTQYPRPLIIYATSRSGSNLNISSISPNEIRYAKLDITSIASIHTFLQSSIPETGKIDILINNVGINNNNNETSDTASQTIDVNYHSTKTICNIFLHEGRMKNTPGARIVNVSSTASTLSNYPSSTQSRFRSVRTISDIDVLADEYITSVKSNAQEAAGFGAPPKSYQVSKALLNSLTVVLARENKSVKVNCCCPGWVDSDMGRLVGRAPKTAEEGARIPVRLAVGVLGEEGDGDGGFGIGDLKENKEEVSGKYYGNDGVIDVGWGKIQNW
ncbi:hypothetical protein HRS9122_08192 [Pyrenophora teres f. teres]|nr:hypothetical protein HRS9122_08192 [Pyrenophora teres f. teres]